MPYLINLVEPSPNLTMQKKKCSLLGAKLDKCSIFFKGKIYYYIKN